MGAPQRFTTQVLAERRLRAQTRGYPIPKWVRFCQLMREKHFKVFFYDSRSTVSKYVYIRRKGHSQFKVRFSNHKANFQNEKAGDSDFYVGVGNAGVTTTEDAIKATLDHFGVKYTANEFREFGVQHGN